MLDKIIATFSHPNTPNSTHLNPLATLNFWRTSPEFALEFNLRRGSRKALSSKSLGNVKKRVDPLTKGGCDEVDYTVAFTPKGGCPLKRESSSVNMSYSSSRSRSIHPQGLVPIETNSRTP